MVTSSGSEAGRGLARSAESLRTVLVSAETTLSSKPEDAERRAKAVTALVRASRDVSEFEAFARAQPQEENEEALRAELRRRVAQLADAVATDAPDEVLARIGRAGSAA
jgi:hypothetical protein